MSIANAICDQSGFKVKLKKLRMQWDNAMVLPGWRDARPKQLEVPPVRENMFVQNMRPEQPSIFLNASYQDIIQELKNNGL